MENKLGKNQGGICSDTHWHLKKCKECRKRLGIKRYEIHLKSHCFFPDYDDQVIAGSKDKAIKLFLKDPALREWDKGIIEAKVYEVL